MTKTKTIALLVAVVGSLLYLKTLLWPPATWETYHDAGIAAYSEGNYGESEKQFATALKVAEEFSLDDPRLHFSLNNMIEIYRVEGKYAEVEPLIKRMLAIDEKLLGPEHPNVAASLNNLADNYRIRGKDAEAEPLYQRALKIWEKTLGPDHPIVANTLESYAGLLRKMGRTAEAEKLEARAKAIRGTSG